MFPLSAVVFPGSAFTLRVFEPRYLELVKDCVDNSQLFGVCLIEKGHEVGGGDERYEFGTLAEILQVVQIGNGQLAINCAGRKRFRILSWLPDNPYPNALVEIGEVADLGEINEGELNEIRKIESKIKQTFSKLSGVQHGKGASQKVEPIQELYRIVEHSYLGPYDRYKILSAETLMSRFELLVQLLEETDEMYTSELNLRNQSD